LRQSRGRNPCRNGVVDAAPAVQTQANTALMPRPANARRTRRRHNTATTALKMHGVAKPAVSQNPRCRKNLGCRKMPWRENAARAELREDGHGTKLSAPSTPTGTNHFCVRATCQSGSLSFSPQCRWGPRRRDLRRGWLGGPKCHLAGEMRHGPANQGARPEIRPQWCWRLSGSTGHQRSDEANLFRMPQAPSPSYCSAYAIRETSQQPDRCAVVPLIGSRAAATVRL
jgi:hypothetical protein